MEVVLRSSCEEAWFTDGISIAAGPGYTHTHTHIRDEGVSASVRQNLHTRVYVRSQTWRRTLLLFTSTLHPFSPLLGIILSHCRVTYEHIPTPNLNIN